MTSPNSLHSTQSDAYRVLARKYRPDSFDKLIGQDALVRTLSNAITLGRLAHAFVLTGVRGIGKTSTARILARGLNCEGADGNGGPTLSPCGVCGSCDAIASGRHVDVLEMDAASNTGVDDVREIIDGSAYRPVSARFKIYIIDEVHMLSRNAFNALLKTLEEPPDAVKFIFATTEIRKVPVTILSRCQRFDLRRVPADMLTDHLVSIAEAENITAERAALAQIARAAEGSVRDALSLLDQAAAQGADAISEKAVVDMLGQAGQEQVAALLSACLEGQTQAALSLYDVADKGGAEPETVISDMLDIIHLASLTAAGAPPADPPEAVKHALDELAKTGIARLGRAWQVVLTGHGDVRAAPNPRAAAHMVLIKLAHIAPMPTPAEILRKLPHSQPQTLSQPAAPAHPAPAAQADTASADDSEPEPAAPASPAQASPAQASPEHISAVPVLLDSAPPETPALPSTPERIAVETVPPAPSEMPLSIRDIANRCETEGEHILAARIRKYLRPVRLRAGILEAELVAGLPDDVQDTLLSTLARHLGLWTGQPWLVSRAYEGGGKTVQEDDDEMQGEAFNDASKIPLVNAVLSQFSGAEVTNIISTEIVPDSETGIMFEGAEK
ncbi:MAG: DNA polymerase III subunit gamma/tau [Alphaproteobacteria bacterium]|nr:DNA polymerase III subunit gamma/tau [Alphaproteobacteria bacterium]